MQATVSSLDKVCAVKKDPLRSIPEALILSFSLGETTITMRIVLYDFTDDLHLEITHMVTLPCSKQRKGYGTIALKRLLFWARTHDIQSVTASQVQPQSEPFWIKNGFAKLDNPGNDFQRTL